MKLTVKELRAIIRDAYDNGIAARENAEKPSDIRHWRAEYVRDAVICAQDDTREQPK